VAVTPGVGTNWYGGVYYEGDHPYSIQSFVQKHPEARMIDENGTPMDQGVCPLHPAFLDWLQQGMRWLFREFAVGGPTSRTATSWSATARVAASTRPPGLRTNRPSGATSISATTPPFARSRASSRTSW